MVSRSSWGGVWTLLPWAWIVFPTLVLWAAGRWVAHRAAVAYPKSLAVAGACLGATYAAVALLAALFGTLSGAAAMPARAALHAAVLGFAVSVTAMAWRADGPPGLRTGVAPGPAGRGALRS